MAIIFKIDFIMYNTPPHCYPYCIIKCTINGKSSLLRTRIVYDNMIRHIGKIVVGDFDPYHYEVSIQHKNLKRVINIHLGSAIDVFRFRKNTKI